MLPQNQMVSVRRAIEDTFCGRCTIKEKQKTVNDDRSTGFADIVVCLDQPCRLSFESLAPSEQTDSVNALEQKIKLFLSPDITVHPGSEITVEQHGINSTYKCAGIPAVYSTHQEILLRAEKERA